MNKLKCFVLCIIALILAVPTTGCFDLWQNYKHTDDEQPDTEQIPFYPADDPNERGNTNGNIINGGKMALQGDWIYYSHYSNGYIYRIRTDGTENTQLNSDSSEYINVVGDWIYYQNNRDNGYLYRMRTDGKEKTKLNDDSLLNGYAPDGRALCSASSMSVADDWIYYVNADDHYLYKVRIDGTEKALISSDKCNFPINIVGDWIYYRNENDNCHIYKIRADGTEKTQLNNVSSLEINVVGNWIYYHDTSREYRFYKIRTDGTGNCLAD